MTKREEKFISEYILTGNGSEAARRAGYSARCANRRAYLLLQKPEIRIEIEGRLEAMAKEKILTATQLQEFLSSVVRGEVRDEQLMTRLIGRGCSIVESYEYRASVKDRLRAAELLLKIHGAFREKMEVEVNSAKWFADELEKVWKENLPFEQSGLGA